MKEQISYDQFDKIDLRIGTVISVKKNEKARKPSLVVKVDFGTVSYTHLTLPTIYSV